ncbi:hypothetical protein [Micromonospora sp. NPDC047730]|uniref:hypothetical protein n=1 Tax=Micromonospora sp. NPDC047730 TaxID=3364253 RepID=UPI00371C5C66
MTHIFDHTDRDGDRLVARTFGDSIMVDNFNRGGLGATVRLGSKQVADLRAALEPHDPTAKKPEPTPPVIVPGLEYRLLPDARISEITGDARSEAVDDEVTRVRVEELNPYDSTGTARVTGLDGRNAHAKGRYIVGRRFLARLEAPAAEPAPLKVGDVVALKPGAKTSFGGGVYFADDVTRVQVVSTDGDEVYVENVNGSGVDGHSPGRQFVGRAHLGDPEQAPALKVGDRARVTGDSAEWLHEFEPGTAVTLLEESDNYSGGRGGRGGWACKGDDDVMWNVATADLVPLGSSLASDEALETLRQKLATMTGAPALTPRKGATPTYSIVDETHVFRDAAEPEQLDDLRVRAVEKTLELFGASDFEEVAASEIIAVAAYIAGEIDADDEAAA